MIRFEEITTKNVWDVCRLKVTKEQENFVSANIESLAEAYAVNNIRFEEITTKNVWDVCMMMVF